MKNQTKEIEKKADKKEINLDAKNKEVIKQVSVKKFIGLDYEKSTAKEQKRFRAEKRRKLFNIITLYHRATLEKKQTDESKKESFESFKAFVKESYNIPLGECENIFKGTNERREDFDKYITDLKTYLAMNKKSVSK